MLLQCALQQLEFSPWKRIPSCHFFRFLQVWRDQIIPPPIAVSLLVLDSCSSGGSPQKLIYEQGYTDIAYVARVIR